ncbi:MAG TPA: CPBP family glutamic-type intramembrane protease [Ktedonobacterales bacterium]|nr:CPBP family glutamic-type intramembrane protease [Ktedonobacterales bacterium]
MNSYVKHVGVVVSFGILAVVVTLIAGGVWSALLVVNLTISPAVPWAVVVMALLLWLMWQYLGGRWWPRGTAGARRRALRAKPLAGRTLAWALVAGLLSIVALAGLWFVLFRLANLPATRTLLDSSRYPLPTVLLLLVMASLVSSVAEEAVFRGYFQGALERRISGAAAIAIVAAVMAPEHTLTQGFVWPTLIFYLCVDAMLGALAYLTGSIVPGVVVHSIGLLTFFTLVWPGDILRQTVGVGSADAWLWIHLAQATVFAALALLAFARLSKRTSAARRPLRNQ